MKILTCIGLVLSLAACANHEPPSTEIYLLRHAEKQQGTDPGLTTTGRERAERVAAMLAAEDVVSIHSTDYRRTRETAAPLAQRTGLDVELYDPGSAQGLVDRLRGLPGVHVVVGHSNTIPDLVRRFGGTAADMSEKEYDDLYHVRLSAAGATSQKIDTAAEPTMASLAERYVKLALAFGRIDGDYVDAYLGPKQWQEAAAKTPLSLAEIKQRTVSLQDELRALPKPSGAMAGLRHQAMAKRLLALRTRVDLSGGKRLPFDQETVNTYDAIAPDYDADHFEAVLEKISALVPGSEPLPQRVEAFRQQFVIPKEKLANVFDAAIKECRKRTLEHIELPNNENFRIEYVNDKPWSGYNWYQGDAYSLIQINTDLPIFIERAVDLGCHEGYPGHHTYNVLLEQNLIKERGWVEFSLYPLFTPRSLISEGSANYGITMAFPGDERAAYEKKVLFPMAGLDARKAEQYYQLLDLLAELSYSGNEAARDYLDGKIDADQAAQWLVKYNLNSPDRAAQRVRFFDKYRSYVINYNLGRDMVRRYVERETEANPERRWQVFGRLLSMPLNPSDLREAPSVTP